MKKFEIFAEKVNEFMTDAASLFTEVFIAHEEQTIDIESYRNCTDAYYTVQEACLGFEDNAVSGDELIELFDQAILRLTGVNNMYGNSARDLYSTTRNELSAIVNA